MKHLFLKPDAAGYEGLSAEAAWLHRQTGFYGLAGFEGLGFGLVQPKSIVEPRSLKRDESDKL